MKILKKLYSILLDYSSIDLQIEKFRELASSCDKKDGTLKSSSIRGVMLER